MKRKTLLLVLIFSILGLLNPVFAQNQLRVTFLTGSDYQKAIATIGRLMVSDNVLRIYAHDGSLLIERSLSEVDKLVFEDDVQTSTIQEFSSSLRVYPNPAQEILFIEGVEDNTTVRLFSSDGQLLDMSRASGAQVQLSVATLPRGIYLLQVGADILRFIKE